jgi:hypothetical protein
MGAAGGMSAIASHARLRARAWPSGQGMHVLYVRNLLMIMLRDPSIFLLQQNVKIGEVLRFSASYVKDSPSW